MIRESKQFDSGKPHVLFLSNEHSPNRRQSAYAHRLNKLQQSLDRNGFTTSYFSLRDATVGNPILLQPLNLMAAREKLSQCDFIHAGGDATYVASLWKPFTKAKIVYDVHGDTLQEARMQWSHGKDLRSAHQLIQSRITNTVQFRVADRFLFVSNVMRNWLRQVKKRPEKNMALVRNGVDLELFRPAAVTTSQDFVVTYAGGFSVWQGLENLVQAIEKIPDQRIRLQVIGVTDNQQEFSKSVTQRLGERVELLPRMSQAELVTRLADADVLMIPRTDHPALRVALPTKFAEYLALAKPVIVSDIDETADLVRQHQCGLVADPNSDSLAQTITNMSDLSQSERAEMGQRGRALAEQEFSWEQIGDQYSQNLLRWSGLAND